MFRHRIYRAIGSIAALALLTGGLAAPRPQRASTDPLPAFQPPPVDRAVLQVLARVAPNAHVLAAIVVDIDHDGDLDVVARTTDDLMAMWVNEGHDRFVRYQPAASMHMTAAPAVGQPTLPGPTPATVARVGYDACLTASGFSPPCTSATLHRARAHLVRLDQFNHLRLGRAPPSVRSS